ncbi:rhodanese-like domain-containing protein [Bacteroides caecigallinarum]|uniref:rhodanese-like domain-containing protein n=1 Tax=Bacteroides caecigallinarum TaxID=1411144 RepID=UPI001F3EB07F|nr:rhodanese-like domain-containing protein [Bacteroides caecigallinarum]MCF2738718.1 rhodanese-like domain-containing protein [Bacteroides caecigallinarum]
MTLKSIYFMFFVCVFLFGLMACSSKPKDKFTNLSADEFEKLIENDDVQRLDVRTVAEYSEGHIPSSININIFDDKFSTAADEILDKSKPVAVYCKSGRRSRNAARLLVKKGYTVYNLDKGILNWIDLGKDIEK